MKIRRILSFCCILFAFNTLIFAQDSKEVVPVRIGGYGQVQPVTGPLGEYIKLNAGGGFAVEAGLPLDWKVELGFLAGSSFYVNPVKDETLESVMNVQMYGGVYCSVPFGVSGFSFRPELDYGAAVFIVKPSALAASNILKNCYVDQIITFNAGFRYFNPAMAKGRLEFELAPVISVTPEKGSAGIFAGGRIGIFYRVNGIDAAKTVKIEDTAE